MTTDLWLLVYMGVLLVVLGLVVGAAKWRSYDISQLGNRDNLPPLQGWGARAERAVSNLFESLPLFTILVLVAHVSGSANDMTALGAAIFAGARTLHPVFYITGLHPLRSLAWFVAIGGLVLIGLQLG